jgi:two-component system OmpR family sensor kinase
MGRIESESSRMGRLVEDLLLLTRLDQAQPLGRSPVDLAAVAREAGDAFAVIAPDRPLTVDAAPGAFVLGDEVRLRQVVDNLVGNALTHTPPGTPVSVSVRATCDGAAVRLEVADRGPGIPVAEQARVFERFHRLDASRSRATGGAGLGLSIVAAIAAAHGGTVSLRSAPGDGATFVVELPAAPSSTGAEASPDAVAVRA